jgi:hypothetical protein
MDIGTISGIIGVFLTVISLVYAVSVTRQSRREKELVYEVLPPWALASVMSRETGYSIQILYGTPGSDPAIVPSVFVMFLRFMNAGRVPIQRADSASSDPLRVVVKGEGVLDITLADVKRPVSEIKLGPIQRKSTEVESRIDFLFLDQLDGALIQILSTHRHVNASLRGTIVGMPEGIKEVDEARTKSRLPNIEWIIPIAIIGAFAVMLYIYVHVNGGWHNAWLLLLPIAAIIGPLAVTIPIVIAVKDWRNPRRWFVSEAVTTPKWYRRRMLLDHDMLMFDERFLEHESMGDLRNVD